MGSLTSMISPPNKAAGPSSGHPETSWQEREKRRKHSEHLPRSLQLPPLRKRPQMGTGAASDLRLTDRVNRWRRNATHRRPCGR